MQEMEKLAEEILLAKEGEDPLDDESKLIVQRKLRYKLMTKGFFAPHEPKHKKPKIKEQIPAKEDKKDDKKQALAGGSTPASK